MKHPSPFRPDRLILASLLFAAFCLLLSCKGGGDATADTSAATKQTPSDVPTGASDEPQPEAPTEVPTAPVPSAALKLILPEGEAQLCIDAVRDYLSSPAEVDVGSFDYHVKLQAQPVAISWALEGDASLAHWQVEVSEHPDFTDASVTEVRKNESTYEIRFLKPGTTYYVRVSASGGDAVSAEGSFRTLDVGPRFLDVGGTYNNCRDLGGYNVGGKQVLYDKVIRGSSPDDCRNASSVTLTKEGKSFLMKTVPIRTQIDLRGEAENCGRTDSTFKGAKYVHIPLDAYAQCFAASQADNYRDTFRLLADPENYPVYIHCVGGADRTGTVAALLLALLGVDEDDIIRDYALTTFSPVCSSQAPRSRDNIMPVLNGLKSYRGSTTAERCASYLSSLGVTQEEIFRIRAIMFGEDPDAYVYVPDHGVASADRCIGTTAGTPFVFKLNDLLTVKSVSVGGTAVAFTQDGKTVTVPADALTALPEGTAPVSVGFEDGEMTEFTVNVGFIDVSGMLQVSKTETKGDYTYVYVTADEPIFADVAYHFHTRRTTEFPDVEPHILINGISVAYLDDNVDLKNDEWVSSPGSTDPRHRVAVSINASGTDMKLLIRTDWLTRYLAGDPFILTFEAGLSFTAGSSDCRVLEDVTYQYTDEGIWMKIATPDFPDRPIDPK